MPLLRVNGIGRRKPPTSRVLTLLATLAACWLLAGEDLPEAAATSRVSYLVPTGSDDTQILQGALDAASLTGPGAVIELSAGTFHVGRPLIGSNLDVTIRGAGVGKTEVLADGQFNPDGLFHNLPPNEASALRLEDFPGIQPLFLFEEGDVDRTSQPVVRRSQQVVMTDLTLGARGRTVPHYDPNVGADTQRLFSFVWFLGNRPDWTNSLGQTPADTGVIDPEQAQVSTVRASFLSVHFDGRNRARADSEPGGAFDPNPDVRNAFGAEGAVVRTQPLPNEVFFFKPLNAQLDFENCRFTDLPGQAGIFAPQLVGRNDPAWTFGPDAVDGSLTVTHSVFKDGDSGILAGLSDMYLTVDTSSFQRLLLGVNPWMNYESTDGKAIGYPADAPSRVKIRGSTFKDIGAASIWMDEDRGPSLVNLHVINNNFVLAGRRQLGILGNTLKGARIVGNSFSGMGYGAVAAATSAHWRIRDNVFCDLHILPFATATPFLGLPENETQAPVVRFHSADIRKAEKACA